VGWCPGRLRVPRGDAADQQARGGRLRRGRPPAARTRWTATTKLSEPTCGRSSTTSASLPRQPLHRQHFVDHACASAWAVGRRGELRLGCPLPRYIHDDGVCRGMLAEGDLDSSACDLWRTGSELAVSVRPYRPGLTVWNLVRIVRSEIALLSHNSAPRDLDTRDKGRIGAWLTLPVNGPQCLQLSCRAINPNEGVLSA
jgi:hypothetical protein